MSRQFLLLLLLLTAFSLEVPAHDSLHAIRRIQVAARMIATDELGHIFVVTKDNSVVRYNAQGDSTGAYRSALSGDIGLIDASDPLRLLLYYPAFNKAVMLDRQLTPQAELDLRRLRIFSPTAIATSSDGRIWVYDPVQARVLKLDEQGEELSEGTDLRQQLAFVPKAAFLLERGRRLYLADTAQGILVFDQFATYSATLPFKGISGFQAFGQQLVFAAKDTLHSYHMESFADRLLPLPAGDGAVKGVSLTRQFLAVLYERELVLYRWPPQER